MANWWDVAGFGDYCIAAYQPIGADSGSLALRNLARRRYDATVGNSVDPWRAAGWDFIANASSRIDIPVAWSGNYTIIATSRLTTSSQNFSRLFYGGGGSLQWYINLGGDIGIQNGTALSVIYPYNAAIYLSETVPAPEQRIPIAVAGDKSWFLDRYIANSTGAAYTTSAAGSAATIYVGNRDSDNARRWYGVIESLALYSVTLPHAALLELSERMRNIEEWSAWRDRPMVWWMPPATGTIIPLVRHHMLQQGMA